MNLKFIGTIIFAILILFSPSHSQGSEWRPVSGDKYKNISGMALISHTENQTSFLVVHDNKKNGQIRAGIVSVVGTNSPQYIPLEWNGKDLPVDLEAVTTIPDSPDNFMALTSAGRVYHIKLNYLAKKIEVVRSFDVPLIPKNSEFEGFVLQKYSDKILAVWAERGLDEVPAILFWGYLDLKNYSFSQVDSKPVKVPYPNGNLRHISDVKVDETGAVFISSATDPGDDGPFSSAIYYAGVFKNSDNQSLNFVQPNVLTKIFQFNYRKIEALELVAGKTGGFVFATDDENFGASIYLDW